jgi:multidrug transporter EmrE-like cation transporter
MGYVYIFMTIGFTVYGQIILKYAVGRETFPPDGLQMLWFILRFSLTPLVISGYFAALLASFSWVAALSKFELSYAYPFTSLNFVLVVLISALAFSEAIDIFKLVGLTLIVGGVLCLGMSGRF